MVPKDIVICDWHYEEWDDFHSVRFFLEKGFRVWPAGWNRQKSVQRLIEVARREATPRMLGYMATTWGNMTDIVATVATAKSERVAAVAGGVLLGAKLAKE